MRILSVLMLVSFWSSLSFADCMKDKCAIWIEVSKETQSANLYVDGKLEDTFDVSTGDEDHETPNFNRHPDGRIYTKYTSTAHPGGDYKGLGNMPYAVFIKGGYALHGTPAGNWKHLGSKASHGCIRMHPDNAKIFNALVREHGVENTWVTVK